MTTPTDDLLAAFDGHDLEGVRAALAAGADARSPIDGKVPAALLLEQYWRSDRLPNCLRLLLDHGATLPDPSVTPIILDDADAIQAMIHADPALLRHRTTLVSTFTSMVGVTLLHVAAEYGHLRAARTLIELGADVNATAEVNEYGLNGHTPIFHTVNSNANRSAPLMQLLLDAGAKADIPVKGIEWGKGFEWETICFDVTPVSYAQMGLLRQFQRTEPDIYGNIRLLLAAAKRKVPPLDNIPNRYLRYSGLSCQPDRVEVSLTHVLLTHHHNRTGQA